MSIYHCIFAKCIIILSLYIQSTASFTGSPIKDARSSPLMDEYACETNRNALFLVLSETGAQNHYKWSKSGNSLEFFRIL